MTSGELHYYQQYHGLILEVFATCSALVSLRKLRGMDKAKENSFTLNPNFLVSIFTDLFLSSSSSLPPPTSMQLTRKRTTLVIAEVSLVVCSLSVPRRPSKLMKNNSDDVFTFTTVHREYELISVSLSSHRPFPVPLSPLSIACVSVPCVSMHASLVSDANARCYG